MPLGCEAQVIANAVSHLQPEGWRAWQWRCLEDLQNPLACIYTILYTSIYILYHSVVANMIHYVLRIMVSISFATASQAIAVACM